MIRNRSVYVAVVAVLAGLLAGCQPKIELSKMMKQPARPVELDRLDTFVGTWEGTYELKAPGTDEVTTGQGTETVEWVADKWLLVSTYEYSMGEGGDKMIGAGAWAWDPKAREYRMWSYDNYGECYSGSARFDERTRTWHMKGKTRNSLTGETTCGEGTIQMVDENTQDWNWTEYGPLMLSKYFELKGTSRRQ